MLRRTAALSVQTHSASSLLRQRVALALVQAQAQAQAPSTDKCLSSFRLNSPFHSRKCSIGINSRTFGTSAKKLNISFLGEIGNGKNLNVVSPLSSSSSSPSPLPPSTPLFNPKKFYSAIPSQPQLSNIEIKSQQERKDRMNQTNQILNNVPIGSMNIEQIVQTKNLMYRWLSSEEAEPSQWPNQSKPIHPRVFEVATVANSLLQRLIHEYDEGCNDDVLYNAVSVKEYNAIISTYGKSINGSFKRYLVERRAKRKNKTKVDGHGQVQVLVGEEETDGGEEDEQNKAIIEAEALIHQMKERFDNYNNLFSGDSSSDSATGGGYEYDMMMPPKPDIITYNTLLSAYANLLQNEAAVKKAEQIMLLLENNSNQDNDQTKSSSSSYPQPDTLTYNMLMNIYANQIGEYGYAQKAEDVLLKMSKLRKEGSNAVVPDTTSFNIVLKAWRNSGGGSIECKFVFTIFFVIF